MGSTLQDVAIDAVATAVSRGSIATKQLSVLPIDLLQRVIDQLVQKGGSLLTSTCHRLAADQQQIVNYGGMGSPHS